MNGVVLRSSSSASLRTIKALLLPGCWKGTSGTIRLSCESSCGRWNDRSIQSTQQRCLSSTSNPTMDDGAGTQHQKRQRQDPLAKRPNKKCDPYGLGGKPLPVWECNILLSTLNDGWQLVLPETTSDTDNNNNNNNNSATPGVDEEQASKSSSPSLPPTGLQKEFVHDDFLEGSRFVQTVASVAQWNNHFPVIQLERRLMAKEKAWQIVTTVTCSTPTLKGLSHSDFHIAMVRC